MSQKNWCLKMMFLFDTFHDSVLSMDISGLNLEGEETMNRLFFLSLGLVFLLAFGYVGMSDAAVVALWHFNEGQGTIAADSSGNGNEA